MKGSVGMGSGKRPVKPRALHSTAVTPSATGMLVWVLTFNYIHLRSELCLTNFESTLLEKANSIFQVIAPAQGKQVWISCFGSGHPNGSF